MNKPLVSIILVVYNTELNLRRCLESILRQDYAPFELIAVDDGSTDSCPQILSEYAKKDSRLRVIRQENQGHSAARNTGMAAARGDWFLFADSDDWAARGFVSIPMEKALESGSDMVLFDCTGILENEALVQALKADEAPEDQSGADEASADRPRADEDSDDLSCGNDFDDLSELVHWPEPARLEEGIYTKEEILLALATSAIMPNAWNKLYRKELFNGVQFPVGESWDVVAMMHLVIDQAHQISVIHDSLYYYVRRRGSITTNANTDNTIYFWRFRQHSKRYRYMEQHYPEIAEAMAGTQIEYALKYCAYCSSLSRTKEVRSAFQRDLTKTDSDATAGKEFRRTRNYLLHHFPHTRAALRPRLRAGYALIRFAPHLFRLAAKAALYLKKRKGLQIS